MSEYFFYSCFVTFIGLLGSTLNFVFARKFVFSANSTFKAKTFLLQTLFGFIWVIGVMATTITGVMWAVQYLKG